MRIFCVLMLCVGCSSDKARAQSTTAPMKAQAVSGLDTARRALPVALRPVFSGIDQPTDIQAVPGQSVLIVLQKAGGALWLDPKTGRHGLWFQIRVNTRSEQGLLGLAFHPKYAQNGRFFLNYNVDVNGQRVTRIDAWQADQRDPRKGTPKRIGTVLETPQPYANHDAGQLAFGPDGMLYVGLGDGGAADDPQGHGQNRMTWLGSMLRIDVNGATPYVVPKDNPFVGQSGVQPEIWAYGLRNPWRYAFAPDGRLIVADVGQNTWEEITIVGRGENHGWALMEGLECFPINRKCSVKGTIDPVYVYPRADGNSITGGYVYTGSKIPKLKGKYVFADFGSGRMWALDLPKANTRIPEKDAWRLGHFDMNPSTFGVGADGALYVGDFRGRILEVVAP